MKRSADDSATAPCDTPAPGPAQPPTLLQQAAAVLAENAMITALDLALERHRGKKFFGKVKEMVNYLFELRSALKASIRSGACPQAEVAKLLAAKHPVVGVEDAGCFEEQVNNSFPEDFDMEEAGVEVCGVNISGWDWSSVLRVKREGGKRPKKGAISSLEVTTDETCFASEDETTRIQALQHSGVIKRITKVKSVRVELRLRDDGEYEEKGNVEEVEGEEEEIVFEDDNGEEVQLDDCSVVGITFTAA